VGDPVQIVDDEGVHSSPTAASSPPRNPDNSAARMLIRVWRSRSGALP